MKHSVFLSHAGKQHSFHTAKALKDLGLLNQFHTSSYLRQQWLQDLVDAVGVKFLSKRFLKGLSGNEVKPHWSFELKEQMLLRFGGSSETIQNAVYDRDVKFDDFISSVLNSSSGDIFWGFQGSCHKSLKSAKNNNYITVCELSTGHITASIDILGKEAEAKPEWADSFDNLYFPEEYIKRLEEEPVLADVVVAASSFTKHTLIESGIPDSKIKLLPLGFDSRFIPFVPNSLNKQKKIKLLYTGRVTQRKGVSYMLEAVKELNHLVELDIIGFVHGSGKALRQYSNYFRLIPPMPQHELFKAYQNYDALILPSLFEGFGLVILEAMAAGLPVITTKNTIGADIIENEKNGFLTEVQSSSSIAESIMRLKSIKEEGQMNDLKSQAHKTAEAYSWDEYSIRLKNLIDDIA